MSYTSHIEGIKVDIQAVDNHIPDGVHEGISESIKRIGKHTREINFVDVYLKVEDNHLETKNLRMRVGIPGPDVFAEDTGEAWSSLLKSVSDKIIRQLEKNK